MLEQRKLPTVGLQQVHGHPNLHANFVLQMHFLESFLISDSLKDLGLKNVKKESSKRYQL